MIALRANASYRCRIYIFATTSHPVIVAKLSQYMARFNNIRHKISASLEKILLSDISELRQH
jgi:DNA-binding HxlR family transcriptional regulator